MLKTLMRYYYTIKTLKKIQIQYQFWYKIRNTIRKLSKNDLIISREREANPVLLKSWIPKNNTLKSENFCFLNIMKSYPQYEINWNEPKFGKLWSYNLNYMDYILQDNIPVKIRLQLIHHFIKKSHHNQVGLEPYPIALRGINWIKFLSLQTLNQAIIAEELSEINASLYAQYHILIDNLEYHLLGNHLLEDGFSLLFGAFYFNDRNLFVKADTILTKELKEQILDDGAHFELSPMYHQIILDRLLDCFNLLSHNIRFNDQVNLESLMRQKALDMLYWLNTITLSNNEIPLFNDSAPDIAPTTLQLNIYAASLNLQPTNVKKPLNESGYRKFLNPNYECIIDIGQIGPSYQTGHAHADTFNFVLNVKNEPVIVDTGVSTYDPGITRLFERGTSAHNTVTIQNKNSSEVWSSFRVARRANVDIILDEPQNIIACHDGYRRLGTSHQREWKFKDNEIEITDKLAGKNIFGTANFWLHPNVNPQQNESCITVQNLTFVFENAIGIALLPANIPTGYNRMAKCYKVEITFKNNLKTIIKLI